MGDFLALILALVGLVGLVSGNVPFERLMTLLFVSALFAIAGALREIAKNIKGEQK